MGLGHAKTLDGVGDEQPVSSNGDDSGSNPVPGSQNELVSTVAKIADALDADIFLYNGPTYRDFDQDVMDIVAAFKERTNAMLVLVTAGGDPDAAYRIARTFQRAYKKFICYVPGYCKSAGTLITIGANEVVICDHGELGPLDIQMVKKDELAEMESGAVVFTAIETLYVKSFQGFRALLS